VPVHYELGDDHVVWITIDRLEAMNSLDMDHFAQLRRAWDRFGEEEEAWVAIVTGVGNAFCVGADLKTYIPQITKLQQQIASGETSEIGGYRLDDGVKAVLRGWNIYKPIIAAVNGFALGGGFEIALSCDIIIAAEHARFGLPEPRVGLMAAAGGVHRLPRQIPLKIAMGMMLTGKHITAADALRYGIANEVVPLKDLMPTAEKWAAEIMECSPLSVQASKEAAMTGLGLPIQEALAKHYDLQSKLFRSKDAVEGPLAFSQKRKPNWTGE